MCKRYERQFPQCDDCGRIDERTKAGERYCEKCAEKRNSRSKGYYKSNKDKINDKRRKKREELKKKGICTRCHKEKTDGKHDLCYKCAMYFKKNRLKKAFKPK